MYTIDSNIDLICSLNHLHSTPYFLPFKSFFTSSKICKVLVKQKRTIYTSHLFSYIIGIFIDLLLKLSGDIESNPGPTQCEDFYEKLNSIIASKDSTCQIFSRNEVSAKIQSLQGLRPEGTNEVEKWMRLQRNYKLVSYQGTHILYKKEKGHTSSKRVFAIEEIFEKLDQLHQAEGKHFGRTKLYKNVTQQYYGITEKYAGYL